MTKVYVLVLNDASFMECDIQRPLFASTNLKQIKDLISRVKRAKTDTRIEASFHIETIEYEGKYAKNVCFIQLDSSDINYSYQNYEHLNIETPKALKKLEIELEKLKKKDTSISYSIQYLQILNSLNHSNIQECLSCIHSNFNELEKEYFKKLDGSYYQEIYSQGF